MCIAELWLGSHLVLIGCGFYLEHGDVGGRGDDGGHAEVCEREVRGVFCQLELIFASYLAVRGSS